MEVPKIEKIVVSMCHADTVGNPKVIDQMKTELGLISGQAPRINKSKKAISNFKLRAGIPIGVSVTLRRERMWDFLEKFINFALPRVRDFRGISPRGFDGRGNLNLGLKEQIIFPEINYDKVEKIRGLNISICTTARSDENARVLLEGLGFPFRLR